MNFTSAFLLKLLTFYLYCV